MVYLNDGLGPWQVNLSITTQTSLPKMATDYSSCSGSTTKRQCTLRLATVAHPVTLSNGTATLKAWQLGDNETASLTNGDLSYRVLFDGPEADGDAGSVVLEMADGIINVAKSLYQGNAQAQANIWGDLDGSPFSSGKHYFASLSTPGPVGAVSNYITSNLSTYGMCSMTWADPTTDMVNTIRELMFRSAIAQSASNLSVVAPENLTATESRIISIYKSHYDYLGLAIGCMSI